MAKHYVLVVSVLDVHGNREDTIEVESGGSKKDIKKAKVKLQEAIQKGQYDEYADLINKGETLRADIEVRDADSDDLLWLE